MTKTAHTQGPWVVETATKGFEVCTLHGVERQPTEDGLGKSWVYVRPASMFRDGEWHWPDEAEQLANARLIAAAPDMLEALKLVADSGKFSCFDDLAWDAVNGAIAKAEARP